MANRFADGSRWLVEQAAFSLEAFESRLAKYLVIIFTWSNFCLAVELQR